jgi:hypothetical protein
MSKHESGGGTVLLAFLAGAISGAAVALLFAPASGDETRQFLSDKARESRERALAAGAGRPRRGAASQGTPAERRRARTRGVQQGAARRGDRVNDWSGVFLGIIALAVTVMAVVQVGVIVFGARLARRVEQLVVQIDRDIKPLVANLNVVARRRRGPPNWPPRRCSASISCSATSPAVSRRPPTACRAQSSRRPAKAWRSSRA